MRTAKQMDGERTGKQEHGGGGIEVMDRMRMQTRKEDLKRRGWEGKVRAQSKKDNASCTEEGMWKKDGG
jgi:hypothetical protein